jgi:2-dehydro-3-deoxy-L-rhamnonate dehydrogenase (NAD+)
MSDQPVALVTGGGSGIGAACAISLAAAGFRVVVADISTQSAEAVAGPIGGVVATVDVSDSRSVDEMVAQAASITGRLDAAVNSAAVPGFRLPLADYDDDQWRRVMSVDFDGVFFCMRAEIRAMRAAGGGSIINISSILGAVAAPNAPAYVAAKHAVVGMTKSAAIDHAVDGVRVNAVGPGFIRTPMVEANNDEEALAGLADLHPLGRLGTPAEVASLVTWLATPQAGFMTGAFLPIDGGYTAR